jgi:hypothetical protein
VFEKLHRENHRRSLERHRAPLHLQHHHARAGNDAAALAICNPEMHLPLVSRTCRVPSATRMSLFSGLLSLPQSQPMGVAEHVMDGWRKM